MCKPISERVNIGDLTPEIAKEEFTRLNSSFEFYLDFGLKAVAFFYAAVGGVLSIYFSVSAGFHSAIIVLLGIPILMSLVLGHYFFRGAHLWRKHTVYLCQLAGKLNIERQPDVAYLGKLLRAFGALFFITSIALLLLLGRVLMKAYWQYS
jgi:hypothetical protein